MRITVSVLVGLALCTGAQAGSFIWFNGGANLVTEGSSGQALASDAASPTAGCFAQLILTGADGTANPARDQGTSVTGDDQVVSTRWFGAGVFGGLDGIIEPGTPIPAIPGQRFYVRAWSAPASSYAGGIPPSFGIGYYGDSHAWTFDGGGDPPSLPREFNFGGNGFSTVERAGADADSDRLPDWWEFLHFRHNTDAQAGGDGDGDHQTNLEEFVAGTLPLDAGSVFAAEATTAETGIEVRWPSQEGRTYTIHRSSNLSEGFSVIETGVVATPPQNQHRDRGDSDRGCAFYLIEVEP